MSHDPSTIRTLEDVSVLDITSNTPEATALNVIVDGYLLGLDIPGRCRILLTPIQVDVLRDLLAYAKRDALIAVLQDCLDGTVH